MHKSLGYGLAALVSLGLGCGGSDSANNSSGAGGATGGGSTTIGSGGSGGTINGNGSTFCVVGTKGCICDAGGVCGPGLVCENNTCCDENGDCTPPPTNTGNCGPTNTGGSSGSAGGGMCTPGQMGAMISDCGYPYASNNPLTSVDFIENEVLRAIEPSGGAPLASIRVFYNDEHALTLGVSHVDVTDSAGTTSKDYAVTPLAMSPSATAYPETGTNELTGDFSGLDQSGRPMWPVLYVTDTTDDPSDTSGDWQQCGTPYNPNAVFGSWKSAIRTVDNTLNPADVSISPDVDPAKNDWNLAGGDPVPAGLKNEGFGAEVRWNLVLIPGRSYRIQVLVHDGDQNKAGGDSGEACVNFCASESCPTGSQACEADNQCPNGYCVSGCCIPEIQ